MRPSLPRSWSACRSVRVCYECVTARPLPVTRTQPFLGLFSQVGHLPDDNYYSSVTAECRRSREPCCGRRRREETAHGLTSLRRRLRQRRTSGIAALESHSWYSVLRASVLRKETDGPPSASSSPRPLRQVDRPRPVDDGVEHRAVDNDHRALDDRGDGDHGDDDDVSADVHDGDDASHHRANDRGRRDRPDVLRRAER